MELKKALAVDCAVEAKESAPRTLTRKIFIIIYLTVLANSSNHSRARSQYRMQVSNMFTVNFIIGPS